MRLQYFYLALFSIFLFSSCSDDSDANIQSKTANYSFPFTVGNQWEYKITTNIDNSFYYSTEEMVKDETVNGITYAVEKTIMDPEMMMGNDSPKYTYFQKETPALIQLGGRDSEGTFISEEPNILIDYPLEIGKSWNNSAGYKNTVIDTETITVEAGTFDCYKIEQIAPWMKENDYQFMYVSSIGRVKTTVGTDSYIYTPDKESYYIETEIELVSYNVK